MSQENAAYTNIAVVITSPSTRRYNWSDTGTCTPNGAIAVINSFSAINVGTKNTISSRTRTTQQTTACITASRRYLTRSDFDSAASRKTRSRFPVWQATKHAVGNSAPPSPLETSGYRVTKVDTESKFKMAAGANFYFCTQRNKSAAN